MSVHVVDIASVEGTLKGWDQLLNLVLDDVEELVRGTSLPFSPFTCDFRSCYPPCAHLLIERYRSGNHATSDAESEKVNRTRCHPRDVVSRH
jgi:small nuclear ribonucleoprotein (snRNP)-like protein